MTQSANAPTTANPQTANAAAPAPVIEWLDPKLLTAYAANSRVHDPLVINQLKASIVQFGFTNPVLVDADNVLIAGHGRTAAAIALGLPSIPCLRVTNLSPTQVRAYVLADNRLALGSTWDEQLLRAELLDLQNEQFDLNLLGFAKSELERTMVSFAPGTAEDQGQLDTFLPKPEFPQTCPNCKHKFTVF